jgi:hypothetical protein
MFPEVEAEFWERAVKILPEDAGKKWSDNEDDELV